MDASMEVHKEDESPKKKPITGTPSILYLIDNIPQKATKHQVISHFQKRRLNGGEVVDDEYQSVGPSSALLLFENAEEVSELEQIEHFIENQQVHLYPLVKEHVSLVLSESQFVQNLITDTMKKLPYTDKETLQLATGNGSVVITGNWLSIQKFRQCFQESMFHELGKSGSKLFDVSRETTESSLNTKIEPGLEDAKDEVEADDHTAKGSSDSSLNPDVLALMEKTGVYLHPALSYDIELATFNISCDDDTEKEKIKEEMFSAYQELMMSCKLKEHTFAVDNEEQAKDMIDECNKIFHHTYFKYDSVKKEIKCLSNDARQMQNVRKRLKLMKQNPKSYDDTKDKSVSIDLPKLFRKVTIQFGDIVEEEVDIIVNAANEHLAHAGGVAAAIDKASYGIVQRESTKLVDQSGAVPTGNAVLTSAGGKLRCRYVVHAVGPMASQHKDQCGPLLHKACLSSMNLAQRSKVKSISFPPISSGLFGVPKELVARVMLSTLCSYPCSDPELLNDVRIVIIDQPTFDVFLKLYHEEKENLQQGKATDILRSAISQHSFSALPGAVSSGHVPQNHFPEAAFINFPKLPRRVTIKLGDIVQEKVDVIVNAANHHLQHFGGVAKAIDEASNGMVQKESNKILCAQSVSAGDAVMTTAGGRLKCHHVVHAIGPDVHEHKDQCRPLLNKACINAMIVAQNFEATSVAFPPISSGTCGVPNETVAHVMLSALCSFRSISPALLSDIRIVIIDRPTFEVFMNIFNKERQLLESLSDQPSNYAAAAPVLKSPTFQFDPRMSSSMPLRFPASYSQALTQQPIPTGGTNYQIGSNNTALHTSPIQTHFQNDGQSMTGVQNNNTSSAISNNISVTSSSAHNASSTTKHFQVKRVDSSITATSNANTNSYTEGTGQSSSKSEADDYHKDNDDTLIDSYKEKSDDGNDKSKEALGLNKSPGYDTSVDPITTNQASSALQSTKEDGPLTSSKRHDEISDKKHDETLNMHGNGPPSSAEAHHMQQAEQDQHASVQLHNKHLPSAAANSNQSSKKGDDKKENESKSEDCPICLETLKGKAVTAITACRHCKQAFCKGCLHKALEHKPYCPTCTVPLRKITGNQPAGGTMTTHTYPHQNLPGYEQFGTIQIDYHIPSGKQGKEHPNPGQYYHGTSRTAYVPDSEHGRKVVRLLKKAFAARLIFTVGTSHTSGATNAVVWNDIHHKTSMRGGPTNFGYPDPTYLTRVLEELAAKGIKE